MPYPRVGILPKAAKRVRHFDGWVFRDEISRIPAANRGPARPGALGAGGGTLPACPDIGGAAEGVPPAAGLAASAPEDVVEVVDAAGAFLAYAFYQSRSHIPLRILSLDQAVPVDEAFWRGRLLAALERRRTVTGTDAKRLVYSEADQLPGLIVDQYGQYLVLQLRTAGMDRRRGLLVDLLRELLAPRGILERSDQEFREDEGLPPATQLLWGEVPERLKIREDDLHFWVDPHRGHKTGFYLDQRLTRRKLREAVAGGQTILDTFSYTGSLAIAAAKAGARVVCVEQDETCVALGKENAALNGVEGAIEWVAGDAFYWLQANAEPRYDWVLLDPPALTKTKTDLARARSALHHLLVHGLRRTIPGGRMLLSLCTYHLLGVMEEAVRIAAEEDGLRLRMLDGWTQPEDHPWVLQMPATRYLVTWMLARDERPSFDSLTLAQDDREQAQRVERSAA